MSIIYLWKDAKVVELVRSGFGRLGEQLNDGDLYDCLCVDTQFDTDNSDRYGEFTGDDFYWWHTELTEFPKEFQLALTLLGVE